MQNVFSSKLSLSSFVCSIYIQKQDISFPIHLFFEYIKKNSESCRKTEFIYFHIFQFCFILEHSASLIWQKSCMQLSPKKHFHAICTWFGAHKEGDGKKTSPLHSHYTLLYFSLKNPFQLAVSDSIRYLQDVFLELWTLCLRRLGGFFFGQSPLNFGLAMNRGCFHKHSTVCSWTDSHHALLHCWLKQHLQFCVGFCGSKKN